MKKLMGYPPAIVFMLLEKLCGVMTTPENDVMGNVTQLMLSYLTGQNIHYMEYYEFFEDSMLIGTPDYVPASAIKGDITMLPTAFGLLSASLLNVSKVKDGYVTCARLYFKNGRYYMHLYTAEARQPMAWQEFGWTDPIPQLCSLQVFPDSCTVEEFAQLCTVMNEFGSRCRTSYASKEYFEEHAVKILEDALIQMEDL